MHNRLLVIALAGALSACGGSSDDSAATPSNSQDPESISTATPEPTITATPDATVTMTPSPGNDDAVVADLIKGQIGDNDSVPTINCTHTVDSISALDSAVDSLAAGDTLCLANGTYTDDFELSIDAVGTADAPITIAAETSGGVTVKASSVSVSLGGEHLIFQGFIFRDGEAGSYVIKFKDDNECQYCRVTEVALIDMDATEPYESSKWIEIYGQYNRIDHSYFSGKTARGALMVMPRWIDEADFNEDTWPAEYAQIDHNYFGNRPPAFGKAYAGSSDNEYEAVRLGLSTTHTAVSNSIIEYNYFERIQGEAEVISNKSTDNTIRYNTVRDSAGSIVTRHGSGTTISSNIIIGDDNPFSGGIRLVDSDHVVTNNYVEGARYLSSNWNGGIVLTTGDGSGRTDNGYQNVENVLIANNTVIDSVNSFNVSGGKNSIAPSSVYFVNNIIDDAIGAVIRTNGEDMPTNSIFAGNYAYGQAFSDEDGFDSFSGISFIDAALEMGADMLYRPSANSPDLSADTHVALDTFVAPTTDMDGQTRSIASTSGADEPLASAANRGILSADLVGPLSYTPTPGKQYITRVDITNYDFDSGDFSGWTNNGATITATAEEVFSRGYSLKVDTSSASASQTITLEANTNYTLSAFTNGVAKLAIAVGDQTYAAEQETSSYNFTSVSFNSGDATSAVITASIDDFIIVEAVADSDFVGFKAGDDDWTTVEGDTSGDVGTSSNSASGADGSAKLGYTQTTHANTSPKIQQTVTLDANKDYAFSIDMLVKSTATGSSATVRIDGNHSVILDDLVLNMSEMQDVDLDDGFMRHTQSLNSGENTSAIITVSYNPHDIVGTITDGTTDLSSTTKKANELRIDNVSLKAEGVPAEGSQAFFDSIRLISHPLSPAESIAAED